MAGVGVTLQDEQEVIGGFTVLCDHWGQCKGI